MMANPVAKRARTERCNTLLAIKDRKTSASLTLHSKAELETLLQTYFCDFDSYRVLYGDIKIGQWDVSRVTNMDFLFSGWGSFNENIDQWDMSNVVSAQFMFQSCRSFNQPLNKWKLDKLEEAGGMFRYCANFNQPLNDWNVARVINMREMFSGCHSFNQPLDWNVESVKTMEEIFFDCMSASKLRVDNWKVRSDVRWMDMFGTSEDVSPEITHRIIHNVTVMLYKTRATVALNWKYAMTRVLGMPGILLRGAELAQFYDMISDGKFHDFLRTGTSLFVRGNYEMRLMQLSRFPEVIWMDDNQTRRETPLNKCSLLLADYCRLYWSLMSTLDMMKSSRVMSALPEGCLLHILSMTAKNWTEYDVHYPPHLRALVAETDPFRKLLVEHFPSLRNANDAVDNPIEDGGAVGLHHGV